MADPIGTVTQFVETRLREIDDLSKRLDLLAQKFSEGDLSRVIQVNRASDDMKKFLNVINGVTAAQAKQHRVTRELSKAYKEQLDVVKKLAKERKDLLDKQKSGGPHGAPRALTGAEAHRLQDLNSELKAQAKHLHDIYKLQDPKKQQQLIDEFDNEEKSLRALNIQQFVVRKGLDLLVKAFAGAYNWAEKLQKVTATLAERFGAGTDAIIGMAATAKREFLDPKGLGGMGFQLEEVSQMLGDFREQLEFTGKITDEQGLKLVKWGKIAGLTATEVGELARSIVLQGGAAQEAETFMVDLVRVQEKSGVTARALSKQFLGAGKSLFELTGPKARQALVESAAQLAKMGTGLDKLKGFIDLTDSFDKTTEAAAKLNTVFGTSINALELFAIQDPAKRFLEVSRKLRASGLTPDMIRQEKSFLMTQLQVSEATANAALTAMENGTDYTKELKKQEEIEKDRLDTQAKFDSLLNRGRKVLIAWDLIAAKFFDRFSQKDLIGPLTTLFNGIIEFVESDAMMSLVTGLTDAFRIVGDVVNAIWLAVATVGRAVMGIVGALLQGLGFAWKLIKWGAGKMGFDLGEAAISDNDLVKGAFAAEKGIMSPFFDPKGAEYKQLQASQAPTIYGLPDADQFRAMRAAQSPAALAGGGTENLASPTASPGTSNAKVTGAAPGAPAAAPDQTIHVQLTLDGEVLQDKLYKANLRRVSGQ